MRIALYQPDMPPSVGAFVRLCACFAVPLDIIEPCGFPLSDPALKRVAMDYIRLAQVRRFASWERYLSERPPGRLVLLTTKARTRYTDFRFATNDTLLLGRESVGAPPEVHRTADAEVLIPLAPGLRSLNIVVAGAIVLTEAMRQTDAFPGQTSGGR